MRKVRDYVRSSKVASAVVSTVGVGSFLTLVFSLTLWAMSHGKVLFLHGEREFEYLTVVNVQLGHVELFVDSFNGLETSWLPPNAFEAGSFDMTPELEDRFRERIRLAGWRFKLSVTNNLSVAIAFPLWLLALCSLATFAAASAISFRFTIRTLLVASTIGCLILGWLSFAVHTSR